MSYRQIRRQTRRARRAGLQPIVVIDSPFPAPAALLLARLAWRYRSEVAPAVTAGAVLAAGWWLHAGIPAGGRSCSQPPTWARPRWPCSAARVGLTRLAERVYAAATVAAGGRVARGRRRCSARSCPRCRKCWSSAR